MHLGYESPPRAQRTEGTKRLHAKGTAKGTEKIITGIKAAEGGFSARYYLADYGERAFLRMNSNSYLGLAFHRQVIEAEATTAEQFGTGPGAVRFISGTYQPHIELERSLAAFHSRESAMSTSAAYAAIRRRPRPSLPIYLPTISSSPA